MSRELSMRTASLWRTIFVIHDFCSALLVKHLFLFKRGLLVIAHLSLVGFLFPDIRKDFGEFAANILIFSLFLSPLARITRMRLLNQMMSLRREMGILMAYLAIVHGVGYIIDPAWASTLFPDTPPDSFLSSGAAYAYGFWALVLTFPLLITSNNLAQKYLGGKAWKRVHRVVYAVFVLAILHRFLQRGDASSLVQAFILLGSYLLLKIYAWRPFWAGLNAWMQKIGALYKEFSLEKKQKV
jgi:DMSO/TMAO reductase YedYZ heme-binding membrane subunit